MGTNLIDTWAKRLINQKFTWGINDCHQLLYDFLKLQNIDWKDPHNYGSLRGTYNNRREASRVAEEMKPVKEQLEELGYTRRPVNRVEAGDIVWVPNKKEKYDMYLPVIYGQTCLCSDLKDLVIKQVHVDSVVKPGWEVFRKAYV